MSWLAIPVGLLCFIFGWFFGYYGSSKIYRDILELSDLELERRHKEVELLLSTKKTNGDDWWKKGEDPPWED